MKIAIVGSGNMGAALGAIWSQKGHEVKFCFSKDTEKLKVLSLLNQHTSTGSIEEAVAFADVVMLAVPYASLEHVLAYKDSFSNKIIITCVSGLQPDFTGETIGLKTNHAVSIAEQIAEALPSAKIVEAFNTTFAEILKMSNREIDGKKPTVFYCGDDVNAKKIAAGLIEDCGYVPINSGNLRTARTMETFATSWVQFAVVAGLFPRIGIHSLQY